MPRPRRGRPTSIQQIVERVSPLIVKLERCGMDEMADDLRTCIEGDRREDTHDSYGEPLIK